MQKMQHRRPEEPAAPAPGRNPLAETTHDGSKPAVTSTSTVTPSTGVPASGGVKKKKPKKKK